MEHLTQIAIDQFTSNIENDSDNIFELQDHISVCAFCSKKTEEALSFNVNLSNFLKVDLSPKLKTFIKDFQTGNNAYEY